MASKQSPENLLDLNEPAPRVVTINIARGFFLVLRQLRQANRATLRFRLGRYLAAGELIRQIARFYSRRSFQHCAYEIELDVSIHQVFAQVLKECR